MAHEDFNTLSYDSDIALIQLSSPLEYSSAVRPVCLPHSTEPPFSSEICAVTGWGSISGGKHFLFLKHECQLLFLKIGRVNDIKQHPLQPLLFLKDRHHVLFSCNRSASKQRMSYLKLFLQGNLDYKQARLAVNKSLL